MKLKNFEYSIYIGKYIIVRSRLKMYYLSRCYFIIGVLLVFLILNFYFLMRFVLFLFLIWIFKVIFGDFDLKLSILVSFILMEYFVSIKDLVFCNKMIIFC